MHVIRQMLVGEEDALVQILVNGFSSDPISALMDPDPQIRKVNLTKLFTGMITGSYLVETTPDLDGVAIWKETTLNAVDTTESLPEEVATVFKWVDDNAPTPPYCYLAFIATKQKGNGVGKALIKHRLAQIGSAKAALWTGNPANVGFYEHVGFQVLCQKQFNDAHASWLVHHK